jgi:hypothetical protein
MTHLEAYSDALLALAWDFLAYFPTFWGNVLRGTLIIVAVGVGSIGAATLFAGILWESKRKQEARAQLAKFQETIKGGSGWSI